MKPAKSNIQKGRLISAMDSLNLNFLFTDFQINIRYMHLTSTAKTNRKPEPLFVFCVYQLKGDSKLVRSFSFAHNFSASRSLSISLGHSVFSPYSSANVSVFVCHAFPSDLCSKINNSIKWKNTRKLRKGYCFVHHQFVSFCFFFFSCFLVIFVASLASDPMDKLSNVRN